MSTNVWDEITYPVPNFNGCTVEVWDGIIKFIPLFKMILITLMAKLTDFTHLCAEPQRKYNQNKTRHNQPLCLFYWRHNDQTKFRSLSYVRLTGFLGPRLWELSRAIAKKNTSGPNAS